MRAASAAARPTAVAAFGLTSSTTLATGSSSSMVTSKIRNARSCGETDLLARRQVA